MKYKPSLQDEIIVCRSHALYEYDQQVIVKLYNPLFSNPSTSNLYSSLNSVFAFGSNETPIMTHQELLRKLNCNSLERFEEMRIELEAVGLIKTYYKKSDQGGQYIIALKRVISPEKFFSDACLSELLKSKVSKEAFEELQMQFLVHNFDYQQYENITTSFDECFEVQNGEEEQNIWWINFDDSIPEVKNQHFDLNILKYLLAEQKGLTEKTKNSKVFVRNINRMAFMFDLSDQEMAEAILDATTDGVINYDEVRANCVKICNRNEKRLVINKQKVKSASGNKDIKALESVTPQQLVKAKYNTDLLPTEIAMFDELQAKTGVELGVLNVLIIYVIHSKDGQIPSINYFRKILNAWIRAGVKTTEDALRQITGEEAKTKKDADKPEWYKEYLKDLENKEKKEPKTTEDNESLEELEKIFD